MHNNVYGVSINSIHSEVNDDPGPRTSELISTSITQGGSDKTTGPLTTSVDEEGFSVRPQEIKTPAEETSFDSSSDSDSGKFRILVFFFF